MINRKNLIKNQTTVATFTLAYLLISPVPTQAQITLIGQFVPPPPPDQGRPAGSARGGAIRSDCPAINQQPLTAIVPSEYEANSEYVWGLTASARPAFWFYTPYAEPSGMPAEFILLDDEGNNVYQNTFLLTTPGMIQVQLPETVAPLEPNKMYRWALQVFCHEQNSVWTSGGIQRVVLDDTLSTQIEQASALEQASLYTVNGIWFDALGTLIALKQAEPENSQISASWENLMRSVGLESIASEPILNCCSPLE
jgi:Domain of Unknown Function (DUF928)